MADYFQEKVLLQNTNIIPSAQFKHQNNSQISISQLMPRRTSLNDVQEIDDLNNLDRIVIDKRNAKRADAKKNRRNRHYTKLLIKHQIKENL